MRRVKDNQRWDGVCGTPGIGRAIKTNFSHISWEEECKEKIKRNDFRYRVLNMFNLNRNKVESNPSFVCTHSKVIGYKTNIHKEEEKPGNVDIQRRNLQHIMSLPIQHSQQHPVFPETAERRLSISRGTQTIQTGPAQPAQPAQPAHRLLMRVGTEEGNYIKTGKWVQALHNNQQTANLDNKKTLGEIFGHVNDKGNDIFESNSDDTEVSEALSKGCKALQEAIQYKQRAILHLHTTSDVISPTTDIDTEDEDTTDSDDSDEDDESVNIYEEALNCENHTYMNRPPWVKARAQTPTIHKSYCFLAENSQVIEKKKLSRTAKSNPAPGLILGQKQQGHQATGIQRGDVLRTKLHGLQKSISVKLSFFHSKKLHIFSE